MSGPRSGRRSDRGPFSLRAREEERPVRNGNCLEAGGLAGDLRDVAAGEADVLEFAARETVQFCADRAVTTPVIEGACEVHGRIHFVRAVVLYAWYATKIVVLID